MKLRERKLAMASLCLKRKTCSVTKRIFRPREENVPHHHAAAPRSSALALPPPHSLTTPKVQTQSLHLPHHPDSHPTHLTHHSRHPAQKAATAAASPPLPAAASTSTRPVAKTGASHASNLSHKPHRIRGRALPKMKGDRWMRCSKSSGGERNRWRRLMEVLGGI